MLDLLRLTARTPRAGASPRSRSEAGATASEYALLMGFIALVIVVGIGAFGLSVTNWYDGLATGVEAVLP